MSAPAIVRTRCRKGHLYTPENTIYIADAKAATGKSRQCRECKNFACREWNLDRKVERILGQPQNSPAF